MRRRVLYYFTFGVLLYPSWLALMGVHEFGHVLHAWFSGGRVSAVHFGPLEFSRTELSFDPHPQFVAWGGPIWGCVIPLMIYGAAVAMRVRLQRFLCFFSGLCLVVNGAYIGIGWIDKAGDAGTLLRYGASPWVMASAGLAAMAGGLLLWHRLGSGFSSEGRRIGAK